MIEEDKSDSEDDQKSRRKKVQATRSVSRSRFSSNASCEGNNPYNSPF